MRLPIILAAILLAAPALAEDEAQSEPGAPQQPPESVELKSGGSQSLPIATNVGPTAVSQADNTTEVTLANDLPFPEQQEQVIEGNHLVLVTLPDGRGVLGSYKVEGDTLEFRYPHTCHCSRSGSIVRLTRVKE